MKYLKTTFGRLSREESGQSLIEYSLIASLVAVGAMVAMYLLRQQIIALFYKIIAALNV